MFVYVVPLMLDRNRATKDKVQWSAVTVTPSGIGKSVTITDCHSNSVALLVLNESGIAKTVAVSDCPVTAVTLTADHCTEPEIRIGSTKWPLRLKFTAPASSPHTRAI